MFRGLILADLCGKVPAMLYRVLGEALLRAEFLRCQFEAVFLLFFGPHGVYPAIAQQTLSHSNAALMLHTTVLLRTNRAYIRTTSVHL